MIIQRKENAVSVFKWVKFNVQEEVTFNLYY